MIPLLTRELVRSIDADAVEKLGVPIIVLMENAARGAFDVVRAKFADKLNRVLIVGGVGQNGGDGWALARHLIAAGFSPTVAFCCEENQIQGDAKTNFESLKRLGAQLVAIRSAQTLTAHLEQASLIVDALFGTGLDRPVEGLYRDVILAMNQAEAPCVALDLPSGIDANTGNVLGVAVDADVTVTFAAHKRGLHQFPAVAHVGELVLVSIGVPAPELSQAALMEPADVARWLPERARDVHKGTAGHILIVAGSPGKTGAALLSSHAALRTGAGLVTIATRGAAREALDMKVVEVMTERLEDDVERAVEMAMSLGQRMKAAAVGPGLGLDEDAKRLAVSLAVRLPIPTVLDADALTAIAGDLERIRHAAGPRVLTPHPAEAARLLGTTVAEVQANRYASALRLAERTGAVVLLKGARTVVAAPGGEIRVCRRGTAALGSAGTGDVLTGVVASLLAALDPLVAASVGAVLHAVAGEVAAQSDRGLLAHEVADSLPAALQFCRQMR